MKCNKHNGFLIVAIAISSLAIGSALAYKYGFIILNSKVHDFGNVVSLRLPASSDIQALDPLAEYTSDRCSSYESSIERSDCEGNVKKELDIKKKELDRSGLSVAYLASVAYGDTHFAFNVVINKKQIGEGIEDWYRRSYNRELVSEAFPCRDIAINNTIGFVCTKTDEYSHVAVDFFFLQNQAHDTVITIHPNNEDVSLTGSVDLRVYNKIVSTIRFK